MSGLTFTAHVHLYAKDNSSSNNSYHQILQLLMRKNASEP